MREPFLTGSRAYGSPREDSDWDLVVRLSENDFDKLCEASAKDSGIPEVATTYIGATGRSLRFGVLNLLCCVTDRQYDCWKEGTDSLKERAPVTRDEAVAEFQQLRRKAGLL